jgi:hypothetical protein
MVEELKERRARQKIEGIEATADYKAADAAKLKNIERLRRERLAREIANPPDPPKKKKKATRKSG